jgi:hypothetical protein
LKREHYATTPDGRPVWRYRFDRGDDTPTLQGKLLPESARALAAEALGVGRSLDGRKVTVGELAETFDECSPGSAAAHYVDPLDGSTVLHIVGAATPAPLDASPTAPPLLTQEAEDLRRQLADALAQRDELKATLDESDAQLRDAVAALQSLAHGAARTALHNVADGARETVADFVRRALEDAALTLYVEPPNDV